MVPAKYAFRCLGLIHQRYWISLTTVQRWMTWTLVLLLTFPGCLCGMLCLGEDHEEHHSNQDGPTLSHYCDAHQHHHCCSHTEEQNLNSILSESQLDSTPRLEHFISCRTQITRVFYAPITTSIPPLSYWHRRSGRDTLRLCQRLLI
jgi:hypothetical protein